MAATFDDLREPLLTLPVANLRRIRYILPGASFQVATETNATTVEELRRHLQTLQDVPNVFSIYVKEGDCWRYAETGILPPDGDLVVMIYIKAIASISQKPCLKINGPWGPIYV